MNRLLLLLLLSFSAYAEDEFEKTKFVSGQLCEEMLGVWYTDYTVTSEEEGQIRYVTKLNRESDGSAHLKGLNIYIDQNDVSTWEFPSEWSCDGEWYTEKNEWGYTSFKIVSLGSENVLIDELNYLGSDLQEFSESAQLDIGDKAIEEYFETE